MQLFSLVIFITTPLLVLGDGLADLGKIQDMTETAATEILASVQPINSTNGTFHLANSNSYPTQTTLQAIVDIVGASSANLVRDQNSFVNGTLSADLNDAYLSYVDELLSLAQALTARGRAWHDEYNLPVNWVIQSLVTVTTTLSHSMTERNLLMRNSIIRTITGTNALSSAQEDWSHTGNLPGKKTKKFRT